MNISDVEALTTTCPRGGASGGCEHCRVMCSCGYPGRFTPAEAERAMDAGLASRLITLTWRSTTVLRPAIIGWEGLEIAEGTMRRGQCVFLAIDGRCELHATKYKPLECRAAACDSSRAGELPVNSIVAAIEVRWRAGEGKRAIKRWRAEIAALKSLGR